MLQIQCLRMVDFGVDIQILGRPYFRAYQLTNFAKIGSHIQPGHPNWAVPGPEPAIGAN